MTSYPLRSARIGTRLAACFVMIVVAMLVADVVALWLFRMTAAPAEQLAKADRISLAVIRVHFDIDTFKDNLAALASTRDIRRFKTEGALLREKFLENVAQCSQLIELSAEAQQDPVIRSALETLRVTLPSQLDTTLDLASAGDWVAVDLRMRNQVQALVQLSSLLVQKVEAGLAQERAEAIESGYQARRQLVLILPAAALLTLLVAVVLGWNVTRSIIDPLSQLEAGARALAKGDFGHRVAIRGEDQLAELGRVLNDSAQQLAVLYETLRSNEARFRLTIDTIPAFVWSALPDGSVDFINRRWLEFSGLSPEQGVGWGWAEAVHPEDRTHFLEAWTAAVASGKPMEFEARVRRADGQYRWLLIRNVPLHDEAANIVKWYGTSADIDDRKRAEEALRESQAYLAEAQRLSHTGSWAFDVASDKYVYASEECGRIFEFDPHEGLPTREAVSRLIYAEDWDRVNEAFEKCVREKVDTASEFRITLPSGTVNHVHVIRHPVLNGAGGVARLVGTVIDVTERKRAEEERRQSAERFRAIADYTYDWENWIGVDGKLLWVNPAVERITGYSVDECMAMLDFPTPIIAEADREAVAQQIGEAVQGSSRNDFEFRVRHKDGHLVWVAASWQPIYDSRGARLGHRSSIRDIAERKRAEEALRRTGAYLAEAQRLAHTGSWAWDVATGEYVYWSEDLFRIYGINPLQGPLTRERVFQRILPEDLAKVDATFHKSVREKVDTSVEFRIVWPDGTVRHVYVIRHPVLNDAGDLVRLVGTSMDITERKLAEEERERLRQLEADLAHINRVNMLGELATSVAHEVKQPLAGIVNNASASLRWLARDVPDLEEAREGLHRIVRDGKRAGEVIDRIRALTRRAEVPRETLDLNDTMREVLALVGDEAKRNSVTIRTRFAEDLSPVSGDRVQLQQVVLNLVMNGIEAMSSVGERARELLITTRNVDADRVQVSIEDSGIGIDPQKLDKIFDSFYTTKPGGMGMGLSISRSILQAHGGRLWAAANDGPGTAFHFAIPSYHEEESNAGV